MRDNLNRRQARLEGGQIAGTKADLDDSEFLYVRVPEQAADRGRIESLSRQAADLGKHLRVVSSASATDMVPWVLTPLNLLPDAVLDDEILRLRAVVEADDIMNREPPHAH
jgi:hypothetical protein